MLDPALLWCIITASSLPFKGTSRRLAPAFHRRFDFRLLSDAAVFFTRAAPLPRFPQCGCSRYPLLMQRLRIRRDSSSKVPPAARFDHGGRLSLVVNGHHHTAVLRINRALESGRYGTGRISYGSPSSSASSVQFTVPTRTPGQHTQTVRPDGYFRLTAPDSPPLNFFLEVDRSTEALRILVEKARGYRAFYRTGGFARRCGGSPVDFHKYPFRVLMVFMTAERRNNVAELLLHDRPPIRSQVLLTTFAEAISDPFGLIWITPEAYRYALGSDMPTVPHAKRRPYRRPAARDALVESRVEKVSILPRTPPPPPESRASGS